jgi:hypothetical protein
MPSNFEQEFQSTRDAFSAHSLPPGFVITPQADGSVAVDRKVMEDWSFPERSRLLSAAISPAVSGFSGIIGLAPQIPVVIPPPEEVLTTLRAAFQDLSNSQQAELAAIQPLAATDPDSFRARMAALRQATIDSVNAAINRAYDELKNAGLQTPAAQPAYLEAAVLVGQLGQGFINTAGSSFDAVDHAGSLVVGNLSEGASEVAEAFSTAGDAMKEAGETVVHGIESVFSGW